MATKEYSFIKTKFEGIDVYTFPMQIKDLLKIHYIAVRGEDFEEGAVQRVLNKSRIKSIKEFVLDGHMFFNTFIINWTSKDNLPQIEKNKLKLSLNDRSAQVLDGQHRLAGLQAAIEEKPNIGDYYTLTSLCVLLDNSQAASIFLNINSEQKPVPRSLVYDLFGEVEDDRSHIINRASDIAHELNENKESPYFSQIKFPGGSGLVDLATVVSSLKLPLAKKGAFHNIGLNNLENQKKVILNYFTAIHNSYSRERMWNNKSKNPFLSSAGFFGAMEALTSNLLTKCSERKSFTSETFSSLLGLNNRSLMIKSDFKDIEGKTRRTAIKEYLLESITHSLPGENEYEF
jgi:DGQHR domain-containing protein